MQRIIVSLTTTPTRIHAIQEMLTCLTRQTVAFNEILINIPLRTRRTAQTYEIPKWMWSVKRLCINRCHDFGPATKLLGALARETHPDTIVITVDDDLLYPENMIESYMECLNAHGAGVYCTAGFNIPDPFAFAQGIYDSMEGVRGHLKVVQVTEGFGSVLYQRSLFDDQIFETSKYPDYLVYSDDILISNYLSQRNVTKMTVQCQGFGGTGFWESRLLKYGLKGDALHLDPILGRNEERYPKAIDYLLRNKLYYL